MAPKIEITVMRERVVTLQGSLRAWCEPCEGETRLITIEAAALVAGMSGGDFSLRHDARDLHPAVISGIHLVCLSAVLRTALK